MVFTVCVEGVMGSGKSSLMHELAQSTTKYRRACFREPIDDWSLLQNMYDDMSSFAVPFQFQVLFSFHKVYSAVKNVDGVAIVERSPWSSKNIFVESFRRNGHFQPDEYAVYCKIYDRLVYPVDAYLYLKCDTEVAYDRIVSRGRPQERSMTVDYLGALNAMYDETFANRQSLLTHRCYVIDANRSIEAVKEEAEHVLASIVV